MKKRRTVRTLTEPDFQTLFSEVRSDINQLQLHNTVFSGVVENLQKHQRVHHNFPAFFGSFLVAMRTDMVIRLGRIYDPEGTGHESCTLTRCLTAFLDNKHFFTDAAITTRLNSAYRGSNPDYRLHQRPDPTQIALDLDAITTSRARLITLRHKLFAHKDLETILSGKRHGFLSSHAEIIALGCLAHEIWNRHSQVWNASVSAEKTHGEDDYNWLFECLRRGLKVKSLSDERKTQRLMSLIKTRKKLDPHHFRKIP